MKGPLLYIAIAFGVLLVCWLLWWALIITTVVFGSVRQKREKEKRKNRKGLKPSTPLLDPTIFIPHPLLSLKVAAGGLFAASPLCHIGMIAHETSLSSVAPVGSQ